MSDSDAIQLIARDFSKQVPRELFLRGVNNFWDSIQSIGLVNLFKRIKDGLDSVENDIEIEIEE